MVYISPMDSGEIPGRWKEVMDAGNLIWIGANKSGNRIRVARRVTYAMVAPAVVARSYKVDSSRVYVSGFSGGGRVASMVAPEYAQLFKGAVFICGVEFWGSRKPAQLDAVKANRYVFLTGKKDFNRGETRSAHRSYRRAGVDDVLLMDISGMDHSLPSAVKFAEAIAFLDDR
jgi:poly(3-hydroxybutyrate) depolymerase